MENGLTIAHPDLTLQQVIEAINSFQFDRVFAGRVENVIGQALRSMCFNLTWMWELHHSHRNRWRELYERGGRVNQELLNEEQHLNDIHNGLAPWTASQEHLI